MSDKSIKVTDKRMFTAEGELRDEFRGLDSGSGEDKPDVPASQAPEAPAPTEATPEPETRLEEPPPEPMENTETPPAPGPEGRERLEFPSTPEELGGPGFIDLLAMLANPAAIYLGDAQLPDGESVEDLNLARWHIDLLDVLREKTAGNLATHEAQAVEDLLYQLRVRYVQKKG